MSWTPTTPSIAVERLHAGGLVVLPTETVYGLAADAANPNAVARIYAVKARPADHPLILHIASHSQLPTLARGIPEYAHRLAAGAWPGPLTLVLPRTTAVGDHVTGGQETVAVRVPDHETTLAVLAQFGSAVAAPSANRFGRVSPTSLAHVLSDLGADLDPDRDAVLDGGPCRVGVESTIVDCTGVRPRILRPGWYGAEQIQELGGVELADSSVAAPRVPGSAAGHYAPRARVRVLASAQDLPESAGATDAPTGLLALASVSLTHGWVRLAAPEDAHDYARVLYQALREADALGLDEVVAVAPTLDESDGVTAAIRDRLARATAGR